MKYFYALFFILTCICTLQSDNKKFVILIATYNNETICALNLHNALHQNYDLNKYRLIIIDDCSTDRTMSLISSIIKRSAQIPHVLLVQNQKRMGALYNHYQAIHHYVSDDEIVVILDGDDMLAHRNVLKKLDKIYSNTEEDVWMTYGQYTEMFSKNVGFNAAPAQEIIDNNAYRRWNLAPSHLRTYYAWLFKLIKQEDLTINDEFFSMCADLAVGIPLMELAGKHAKFIPQILYIYNDSNPISDHCISRQYQQDLDQYIRSRPKYEPLLQKPS